MSILKRFFFLLLVIGSIVLFFYIYPEFILVTYLGVALILVFLGFCLFSALKLSIFQDIGKKKMLFLTQWQGFYQISGEVNPVKYYVCASLVLLIAAFYNFLLLNSLPLLFDFFELKSLRFFLKPYAKLYLNAFDTKPLAVFAIYVFIESIFFYFCSQILSWMNIDVSQVVLAKLRKQKL